MRDMSSDGAIDKPRSARPARGEDRGVAGIALAVLLVLALIATIVMVFSDNPVWMRIGTLAALWAAFIGAFLVARYRRQAASEAARVRDLHTVYELQLEREISARREHELVVEKDLRDSIRAETSDSVHALRHEIAALREQLGQLGVTLPEDRFAVSGLGPTGELGAGSGLASVPSERVAPRRRAPERAGTGAGQSDAGRPDAGRAEGGRSEGGRADAGRAAGRTEAAAAAATGVGRDATPSTERTEKLSPVDAKNDQGRETGSEQRRPAVRPATRPQSVVEDQKSRTTEMPAVTDPARQTTPTQRPGAATPAAAQPEASRSESSKSEPTTRSEPAKPSEPKPTEPKPDEPKRAEQKPADAEQTAVKSRHGEGGGMSVADLMARLGGDDTPTGGRRRRRSED